MTDKIIKKAEMVIKMLESKGLKIATAESCTGGSLAYAFTSRSGASAVFDCGVVSYSNDIKHKVLNVEKELLSKYGAVSEQVVKAMCQGVLNLSSSQYALATSGVAGPTGGSEEKPVGCVYIGLISVYGDIDIKRYDFLGDRLAIQESSVLTALNLAYKYIAK